MTNVNSQILSSKISPHLPGPKNEFYRPLNLSRINMNEAEFPREESADMLPWSSLGLETLGPILNQNPPVRVLPGVSRQLENTPLPKEAGPHKSALKKIGEEFNLVEVLTLDKGHNSANILFLPLEVTKGTPGFSAHRKKIYIGKNIQATFLIINSNQLSGNHLLENYEFHLEENAKAEVVQISDGCDGTWNLSRIDANLKESAEFKHLHFSFGGELTRQEIEVNLNGNKAKSELYSLILAREKMLSDLSTQVNHLAPETSTDQIAKFILDQNCRAIFRGNFYVAPDAQKVSSSQLNKTLILNNQAEILSRPQLEIYADDVKCSHGATVGEINQEEIFYLQSRGIDASKAKSILTFSRANEILNAIASDTIKKQVSSWVYNKLNIFFPDSPQDSPKMREHL